MDNIIDIELTGRSTRRDQKLWQYDYGQMLRITGKEFPKVTEVQFSLQRSGGHTLDRIGTFDSGILSVQIPNELLQNKGATSDYTIYAFVYLSGDGCGNTKYMIQLPVESRPEPTDPSEDPSIDPSIFKDAVNAVNASAERAETAEKSARESAAKAKGYAESAGKSKEDVENARDNAITSIGKAKESALSNIASKTDESVLKIQRQTEESQNSIKQSIADATKKKAELDGTIRNATDAKGNLDKAVQSAGNAKSELDTSVEKVGEAKMELDSSINSAGEKKLALDATVEQANTVDASLKEQIGSAEQIQANVEQIAKNKTDISSLKEDLTHLETRVGTLEAGGGSGGVSPVPQDKLIGSLPMAISETGLYMITNTDGVIVGTGSGATNVYERDGETILYDPTDVVWGSDSLSFNSTNTRPQVYAHLKNLKPNTTYTLFVDTNNAGTYVRVLQSKNDMLGNIIVQINGSGHGEFTTPASGYYTNIGFAGNTTSGENVQFSNLAIFEGSYSERPHGISLKLIKGTKYDLDGYIGTTLSAEGGTVNVYRKAISSGSESITDNGSVIFFGDSIFDFSDVIERYANKTGKSCLDCTVGGTRMTPHNQDAYKPYSMVNIADSIVSGDFSTQIANGKNSNFSVLASANINQYKAIVIGFGTNDYTANRAFTGTDKTSVQGAMQYVIDSVTSKYPSVRIVFIGTKRFVNIGEPMSNPNGTVFEMNEIMKQVAKENGTPFVDMIHFFGDNAHNRSTLTSDGVHLSAPIGEKRYADILTGQLNAFGI